jgi:ribosome biogenesis protein BMS1
MIDIAKVADLVLLLIDASFGFEMETFEILNVLQCHGFPKIMGVLTHLDKFKNNKKLRTRKKVLKQRFWTEIYQGAKLFYLSGVINGRYPKTEVLNLSRFVSVMKFRPLVWRNAHPYLLSDRLEDLTPPQLIEENSKCDRKIAIMGYLRGTYLKAGTKVHIPGAGDFEVNDVSALGDPCPLPDTQRKSLSQKNRLIYAPMSDVGGVMYDKDAIYIHVPGNFTNRDAENERIGEGEKMVLNLQKFQGTIDSQLKGSSIKLFDESAPVNGAHIDSDFSNDELVSENEDDVHASDSEDGYSTAGSEESERSDDEDPHNSDRRRADLHNFDDRPDEDIAFAEDDFLDVAEDEAPGSTFEMFTAKKRAPRVNLMDIVYNSKLPNGAGEPSQIKDELKEDEDLFSIRLNIDESHRKDTSRVPLFDVDLSKWEDEECLESIRSKFITGDSESGDPTSAGDAPNTYEESGGDFEDLEGDSGAPLENSSEAVRMVEEEPEVIDELERKRADLKKKFDAEYDDASDNEEDKEKSYYEMKKEELQRQVENTREELADDSESRIKVLGHCPGTYVRLILERVPCELVEYFDPRYPVIAGGLGTGEDQYSFMQARIKKHRWYKRILKTNDPLIISLGWRRFQSLPLYSLDDRIRNRMLKYTPLHMHCLATFYGPVSVPNTGFCAFQTLESNVKEFRVAATGSIVDINKSSEIVKKLKLTGTPSKIYKNTAFIKDMFTTALEVAKFEGASIKTVSGIRGQIKKAIQPEGSYRATFEDKILMSDIVFLKAWYPVKPKKFVNPVTSLLLRDKLNWRGMRLANTVRHELNVPIPKKSDSSYSRQINRPEERKFMPLRIPKSVEQNLPFKSKSKLVTKQKRPGLLQRRAVLAEPHERKVESLLAQVRTLKNYREEKKKKSDNEKREAHLKVRSREEKKSLEISKGKAREFYKKLGQAEKRAATADQPGGRFKKTKRSSD